MNSVSMVSSIYLGVYPDIGNITNAARIYGGNEFEDLCTGRGHLAAIHLKETVPGIFREIPFGEGHVDFENAISTAWDLGVRRYVTEFWFTGSSDWRGDLLFANRMMTGILERQNQKEGFG